MHGTLVFATHYKSQNAAKSPACLDNKSRSSGDFWQGTRSVVIWSL